MPGMTLKLNKESPLHKKLVKELSSRVEMAERKHVGQHDTWIKAEQSVQAYVPESEDDARRRADRENKGQPHYTTIQIPYTYALVMAAHTYWTSVFFGRNPVHQVSGVQGEGENQVLAMESILNYQTSIGGLLAPYYLWIYDVSKYGCGWLGNYWDVEEFTYTELEVDATGEAYYKTTPVKGYKGNKVYNLSPYDALPDPRVPVNQFQIGEFFAAYRTISWNDIVIKESRGYYTNIEHIRRDAPTRRKNYRQGDSIGLLDRPQAPDLLGDGPDKRPAWVGIYEVYMTLIPNDWGLGKMHLPEKWVFTLTADLELVLQAQPLGALHNRYPFSLLQTEPEAYALWSRGIPQVIEPLQNTMDWLVNSHFFNIRSIGTGRYVADPSRIDLSELESGEPGWIAVLRPEAWGNVTDIRAVFQQLQMTDVTSQHMVDVDRIFGFGERALGINEQMFGALSSGRKTATEVRTATGFGVNRLKTGAEFMSALGFTPHSSMLIQNTQQWLDAPMKVKLAGEAGMFNPQGFIMVTPEMIAGQYELIPVDGSLPVDRFAQATLWKDLLGQLSRFPQIMAQYDLGKIFGWVAQLGGLKNVQQFRVQVVPDQALEAQAQAGNVIPFQGGGATPSGPGTQSNVATTPTTNVGLPA